MTGTTTIRTRRSLAALAVVAVVALTGCSSSGGDDDRDDTKVAATTTPDDAETPGKDDRSDAGTTGGSDATKGSEADDAKTPTTDGESKADALWDASTAWDTTAAGRELGARFTWECPAAGWLTAPVWGGDGGAYTDDSSICVAAVHAGLITVEDGGTVEVEMTEGLDTYGLGSEANGVTSGAWDQPWTGTITFP